MIVGYAMTKKEAEAQAKIMRAMVRRVRKSNKRLGTNLMTKTRVVIKKAGYTKHGFKWAVHTIG